MKQLSIIGVGFLSASFFLSAIALGQSSVEAKASICIEQMEERDATMFSEDWLQLERLSNTYIGVCKGVLSSESYSRAYQDLSIAQYELGKVEESAATASTCISKFYRNSGCHVQKLLALIRLERTEEARETFRITEKLLTYLSHANRQNLRNASTRLQRALYLSTQTNLNAQIGLLRSLRESAGQ